MRLTDTAHGGPGDRSAWHDIPARNLEVWGSLKPRHDAILAKHRNSESLKASRRLRPLSELPTIRPLVPVNTTA